MQRAVNLLCLSIVIDICVLFQCTDSIFIDFGDVTARACKDTEFKCTNGTCIPSNWQCDNEKDCSDGADESPELCGELIYLMLF